MTRILFVCLGNICRSTMAEFVCKDMAQKRGMEKELFIASAGTSSCEVGSPVHRGTREKLWEHGIACDGKRAVQLQKSDYQKYDLIIGMETQNIRNMQSLFGGDSDNKIYLLLDFTSRGGNISDPWYTGNFESTWQDVTAGCAGLFDMLCAKKAQPHD